MNDNELAVEVANVLRRMSHRHPSLFNNDDPIEIAWYLNQAEILIAMITGKPSRAGNWQVVPSWG